MAPSPAEVLIALVDVDGADFQSTTDESMVARQGHAGDRVTPVIVLEGERNVHGRVCAECWGYQTSCTGERIRQATVGLANAANT
jgi:hypothetical protein